MSDNYKGKIYDIAVNALEITCYMFPLEDWEAEKEGFTKKGIRAVVGFNGAAKGKMVITPSSEQFLTGIASNMLGEENPDAEEKAGALCEIANIICGNTVPLFARNDKICYIEPPVILDEAEEKVEKELEEMKEESVQVFLDEGSVEITVHYLMEATL